MKIAVVLPVYNVAALLPRCLDSLKAQTENGWRAVLVDDGSTDGSSALCDAVAAADVRFVVVHQANGGVSSARNRGVAEARRLGATHLVFVDPDDWVHPEYLAELVAGIGLGIPFAGVGYQDVHGNEPAAETGSGSWRLVDSVDYWLDGAGMPSAPWGKLMAIELFEGLEFPVGRVHEDEARMARLVFATDRVAWLPRKLYCYWHRPESITNGDNAGRWTERSLDHIPAVRDQIAFFAERGLEQPLLAARRLLVTYCVRAIDELGHTEFRPLLRRQLAALGWPYEASEPCFRAAYPIRTRIVRLLRKLKGAIA